MGKLIGSAYPHLWRSIYSSGIESRVAMKLCSSISPEKCWLFYKKYNAILKKTTVFGD